MAEHVSPLELLMGNVGRAEQEYNTMQGLSPIQQVARVEQLQETIRLYKDNPTIFKEGDVLQWKPGLKNRRSSGPFVIMELIDPPLTNTAADSGSPYYREELDIACALYDEYGDVSIHHYDSKRLMRYVPPTEVS